MEHSRANASRHLEQEVSSLLLRSDSGVAERIDAVLRDCAAEALRLKVECLRADRNLALLLDSEPVPASAAARCRELSLRRKGLAAERKRIGELMGALRAHRDQIARSHSNGIRRSWSNGS
jgi:hypothetical protein